MFSIFRFEVTYLFIKIGHILFISHSYFFGSYLPSFHLFLERLQSVYTMKALAVLYKEKHKLTFEATEIWDIENKPIT